MSTKSKAISPSILFNTLKSILTSELWDFDAIIRLKSMSWQEICETLELDNTIRMSFGPNEGRAITHVVIGSLIADNEQRFADQSEIERDLNIAQGWRR